MKQTIVIHEVNKKILDLTLKDYILTFDDALYSQYYYWPLINEIDTKKIIFVCPSLINDDNIIRKQFDGTHVDFPSCYEAMSLYREDNDKRNYMSMDELKELDGVTIGAHSFSHFKQLNMKLYDKINFIKEDTELMLQWFEKNLNVSPDIYSFPHYIENRFQRSILKSYGFKEFYGASERSIVEKLW
jgi:hypothetical protein